MPTRSLAAWAASRQGSHTPSVPISPQVNTTLPARTLLLGWGPYALLHLCAVLTGTALIPPRLQVVRDPQCQSLGLLHLCLSLAFLPRFL